jgi:outer membrane receptor protein involved in Fe transport
MNVDNPAAFGVTATDNVWDVDEPIHIDQKALFGEANYALTDRLKATAGVRWYEYTTRTQMSFSGFGGPTGTNVPYLSDVTQGSSGINPKAGLSYDLDKNLLVYGSVARGFRPGGGNWPLPIGNPSVGACISSGLQQIGYYGASPLTFDPDSVWSYEAGEKGKFLNNRLRVNASLYFEHWNNIQVAQLPCDYPLTVNAPGAHVYGTEVEVQALLSGNLSVSVNTGATHAVFTETARGFDAGDRLPDVAPWTASVNISYHHPLTDRHELTARLEDTYTGTRVDTTFPGGVTDFQTPLPGYNLTNVRVGVAADAGWSATAFIDNLFNKKASLENVAQLTLPNPSYNRVSTNQPLTAGIDLSYRF